MRAMAELLICLQSAPLLLRCRSGSRIVVVGVVLVDAEMDRERRAAAVGPPLVQLRLKCSEFHKKNVSRFEFGLKFEDEI